MSKILSPSRRIAAVMLPLCVLAVTSSFTGAGDAPKGLDQLLKPKPAERMKLVAKVVDKDKDFGSATRGALVETVVERGSLQAVESTEVICRVRPVGKNAHAAIIKWVIDEGTFVKKGDNVIDFDSSAHADLLRQQKEIVAKAEAEQKRAADDLERIKKENGIDVKLAQIDLRLADLALRQYKGNDPLQKETLAVLVERAALLVERVKLQGQPKIDKASETLDARKSLCNREKDRQRELEKDIANCVVTAPQDGMVLYYIPEGPAIGRQRSVVAQGEPVREGQKLLMIPDLSRMAMTTLIEEGQIHKLRVGQAAKIRVDAFPKRELKGKVSEIANLANHAVWLKSGKKAYKVVIEIDGENTELRPGHSAETAITTGEQPNCLRMPASAVLGKGKETFCYVLTDKELHVRKVTVGVSDGKLVEIRSGLKEGELVLRDPGAAVGRLNDALRPGAK